jgi:hypothetical protein
MDVKRHNKACALTVTVKYLMVGVGWNDYKIRAVKIYALVFADDHADTALERVLYLVKGVLGVICEKTLRFAADNLRPEYAAIEKAVHDFNVIFVYA